MHKAYLVIAAVFGGLSVALGAFAAHGLQRLTTDATIIHSFQTGVQYQFYHSLVLLLVGFYYERVCSWTFKWAANFFIAGIILFSGSLYLITLLKIREVPYSFLGPVTPVGGVFLIAGWSLLLTSFLQLKKNV